jgi:hypothetical protein
MLQKMKEEHEVTLEELEQLKKNSRSQNDSPRENRKGNDNPTSGTENNSGNNTNPESGVKSFTQYNYCVIVAAYSNVENAQYGQRILKKRFGLETTIIGKEDGKYMYLCSDFFDDPRDVGKEFERLKKMKIEDYIIGSPWIYRSKKK